jgi:hypothetical protein
MQPFGNFVKAATICFALISGSAAEACVISKDRKLADIKYADVVVVGEISNYGVILDQEMRERHQKMIAGTKSTALPAKPSGFITDYARFDISVEKVLKGEAPDLITVTWDNSTFTEPETMPPGPYLIALRRTDSAQPPLRGPSATMWPSPEPGLLTVLQAPCAPAFILKEASDDARSVRELLGEKSE